jgi:hypothetical protein
MHNILRRLLIMANFKRGDVVRRIGESSGRVLEGGLYKVSNSHGMEIALEGHNGYYMSKLFEQGDEGLYEKEKVVAALEVLLEYNRCRAFEESVGLNRYTSAIYWNSPLPEYSLERFKKTFLETEEDRKKKELMGQMDKLKSEMSKLEEQMEKL